MRWLLYLIYFLFFYSAQAQQSLHVTLLGNWNDSAHIPVNLSGQRYNDVWGFTLKGKEYAAIGSTLGVHIIDIDNLQQVAFYKGKASGNTIVHRDYKVYKNYLYAVCNEGFSSLQVFDLNYLPDSLHLVYESQLADFMLANKIAIDTSKAMLYAGTPRTFTTADQMQAFDISDPVHPVLKYRYNNHDDIHDMFVRNDTAYCSASFYGYEIVDFTSGQPVETGEMHFYPYQGYNHSSWIGRDGFGVMTDETHGLPVKVIDTRDFTNVHVVSNFSPRPGDSTCIPHIPYIVGHFAFVAYYFDGLQIYDISDPANPKQAGYYDTYPQPSFKGFAGAWGCYPFFPSGRVAISDMQTGLYVVDPSEATGQISYNNSFKLYPNPAKGTLFIEFPKTEVSDMIAVSIYDISGKKVYDQSFAAIDYVYRPIQLTLPGNWPTGMYLAKVMTGSRSYVSKFTKL
ncbi:choice-of-anchor B family protein [Chitinophagaceae bacterium MMS25-I14]